MTFSVCVKYRINDITAIGGIKLFMVICNKHNIFDSQINMVMPSLKSVHYPWHYYIEPRFFQLHHTLPHAGFPMQQKIMMKNSKDITNIAQNSYRHYLNTHN